MHSIGGEIPFVAQMSSSNLLPHMFDANGFYDRADDRRRASLQYPVFALVAEDVEPVTHRRREDCSPAAATRHGISRIASNSESSMMVGDACGFSPRLQDAYSSREYMAHYKSCGSGSRVRARPACETFGANVSLPHRCSQPSLIREVSGSGREISKAAAPRRVSSSMKPTFTDAANASALAMMRGMDADVGAARMRHAPSQPMMALPSENSAVIGATRRLPLVCNCPDTRYCNCAAAVPKYNMCESARKSKHSQSALNLLMSGGGGSPRRLPSPHTYICGAHSPRASLQYGQAAAANGGDFAVGGAISSAHKVVSGGGSSPNSARAKIARANHERLNTLKRSPHSDLSHRFIQFQRFSEHNSSPNSNDSTPTRPEVPEIDPVYLALKQATGKYGGTTGGGSANGSRRGSSVTAATFSHVVDGSSTPSPRNLSQASLHDSGYAEACSSRSQLMGSTPQLSDAIVAQSTRHGSYNGVVGGASPTRAMPSVPASASSGSNAGANARSGGTRRPKLSEKMKSLSLDCAEMLPPTNSSMFRQDGRSSARGLAASGEMLAVGDHRNSSPTTRQISQGTHVCIHDYATKCAETSVYLGDRMNVMDNGDPDWLHGFKVNDRTEQLLIFPKTCVTPIEKDEQPMKLIQNVNLAESKLRLYRDQVVFAQPGPLRDNGRTILVRNEHGALAHCPIKYLMLL